MVGKRGETKVSLKLTVVGTIAYINAKNDTYLSEIT
jgi:hypothetical protein